MLEINDIFINNIKAIFWIPRNETKYTFTARGLLN